MHLSVIGAGVVGLVTSASFAEMGHRVICVDNNQPKVQALQGGQLDLFEPDLEELVARNLHYGRLRFTDDIEQAVMESEVVFITVGTPSNSDGSADISSIREVAVAVGSAMQRYTVVVEKSTVPVTTGEEVKKLIQSHVRQGVPFDVASVPEFLREGSAVYDFQHADRVVIGVESPRAEGILRQLFEPLGSPILVTDIKSAELIKHASNCFLATKISYVNALAAICEQVGADVTKVAEGMGWDPRIGRRFLAAGVGYGGSCFPKDVDAFVKIAEEVGYDFHLLKEVSRINREQRFRLVEKVERALGPLQGRTIAVLGLSFKPNTDDMREAPSVDIVREMLRRGALVRVSDPVAMPRARTIFGEQVEYREGAYHAAQQADAVVLLTEWDAFTCLDLGQLKAAMRGNLLVDGRNVYDSVQARAAGFEYHGMGR